MAVIGKKAYGKFHLDDVVCKVIILDKLAWSINDNEVDNNSKKKKK